jgi:hypothetical protein
MTCFSANAVAAEFETDLVDKTVKKNEFEIVYCHEILSEPFPSADSRSLYFLETWSFLSTTCLLTLRDYRVTLLMLSLIFIVRDDENIKPVNKK